MTRLSLSPPRNLATQPVVVSLSEWVILEAWDIPLLLIVLDQ